MTKRHRVHCGWLALLLLASPAAAQVPEGSTSEVETTPPVSARSVKLDDGHGHHGPWGHSQHRSPGLAFAISLTPMPIDFGNLYAENIPWGIAYTTVELALGGGMLWLAAGHMCHGTECDKWSGGESSGMVALVSAYVIVKLVAGTHASLAAARFNDDRHALAAPVIIPMRNGALLRWHATF